MKMDGRRLIARTTGLLGLQDYADGGRSRGGGGLEGTVRLSRFDSVREVQFRLMFENCGSR